MMRRTHLFAFLGIVLGQGTSCKHSPTAVESSTQSAPTGSEPKEPYLQVVDGLIFPALAKGNCWGTPDSHQDDNVFNEDPNVKAVDKITQVYFRYQNWTHSSVDTMEVLQNVNLYLYQLKSEKDWQKAIETAANHKVTVKATFCSRQIRSIGSLINLDVNGVKMNLSVGAGRAIVCQMGPGNCN